MNAPGPILRDIHPAPPPSWWPPAYGWWLLVLATGIVLVVAILWGRRLVQRRRRARQIVRQIDKERERFRESGDTGRLVVALSHWLRRAARLHDERAVRLEGEAWMGFLREHAPRGIEFACLESLDAAVYRPGAPVDGEAAAVAVRAWVRHALARA